MDEPQHDPSYIPCNHCRHAMPSGSDVFLAYFQHSAVQCPNCGGQTDWWRLVLSALRENVWPSDVFFLLGAQGTRFRIKLIREQILYLNFGDYGVPVDATIVDVNFTSVGGGLVPAAIQSNQPYRRGQVIHHRMGLYPVPLFPDAPTNETRVDVRATWIPHVEGDDVWMDLVNAFRSYFTEEYSAAAIPANVAIESRVGRLFTSCLEQVIAKQRVAGFLTDAATYSHQLNVLLPLLARLIGFHPLPDHIRGALNGLRNHRNTVAHKGTPATPPARDTVAEWLCASMFGIHYTNLMAPELLARTRARA